MLAAEFARCWSSSSIGSRVKYVMRTLPLGSLPFLHLDVRDPGREARALGDPVRRALAGARQRAQVAGELRDQ